MSQLSRNIKNHRLAWNWSQSDLAKALYMDQASISFWESGKVNPLGSTKVALAALFSCTVSELEDSILEIRPIPEIAVFSGLKPKESKIKPKEI